MVRKNRRETSMGCMNCTKCGEVGNDKYCPNCGAICIYDEEPETQDILDIDYDPDFID